MQEQPYTFTRDAYTITVWGIDPEDAASMIELFEEGYVTPEVE